MKAFLCGEKSGTSPARFLPALERFKSDITLVEPNDADFLFVTHKPRSFRQLFTIPDRGQIRVYIGQEAIAPDLNLFDFAITFDATMVSDRVFRPHPVNFFAHDLTYGDVNAGEKVLLEEFSRRPHFCDFIYRNSLGSPERQLLFNLLQTEFGGVKSYGDFLKNSSVKDLGKDPELFSDDWRTQKLAIQRNHQFSVCAENARFFGYTSEKILTSLMAGSIPIYWGNPLVVEEFNIKRFLYFDGENFDELARAIREITNTPELGVEIVKEPVFTEVQRDRAGSNAALLDRWVGQFFDSRLSELRYRPHGWYPDWYEGVMKKAYLRERFSVARWTSFLSSFFSKPHG